MPTWYEKPTVPEQAQKKETLLIDKRGRPILVKEPRKVGFDPKRIDNKK